MFDAEEKCCVMWCGLACSRCSVGEVLTTQLRLYDPQTEDRQVKATLCLRVVDRFDHMVFCSSKITSYQSNTGGHTVPSAE